MCLNVNRCVHSPCSVCLWWKEQAGEGERSDNCTAEASCSTTTSTESVRNKERQICDISIHSNITYLFTMSNYKKMFKLSFHKAPSVSRDDKMHQRVVIVLFTTSKQNYMKAAILSVRPKTTSAAWRQKEAVISGRSLSYHPDFSGVGNAAMLLEHPLVVGEEKLKAEP